MNLWNLLPKEIQNIVNQYLARCEYFEKIKSIKKIFYCQPVDGPFETINETWEEPLAFKETRKIVSSHPSYVPQRYSKWFEVELNPGEVIKNLRINSNINVKNLHFEIEIGGHRMDRIESSLFNVLRKIYHMKDDEIPFYLLKNGIPYLAYHKITIGIESSTETTQAIVLSADIYTGSLDASGREVKYILCFQNQWISEKLLKPGFNEIYIRRHLINYYILVESEYDGDIVLNFENKTYQYQGKLKLLKIGEIDKIKIYSLTKSLKKEDICQYGINFSRVDLYRWDKCTLQINVDKEMPFHITTINSNAFGVAGGMAGLRLCA